MTYEQYMLDTKPVLTISETIFVINQHDAFTYHDDIKDFFHLYGVKDQYKTVDVRNWLGY